jgi:hypothetical protein
MGRPRSGTLRRQRTEQGISYGVAFSYRNQQVYVHLGGEWDGWDDERAAEEQRFLMEKVNRGEWTPPPTEVELDVATEPAPTFQVEASQWLHRRKLRAGDPEGESKTIRDLDWRLSVVIDKFGPVPIDRIDFALADELVVELCEERAAIERAIVEGSPLMRTVSTRSGRSYQARRRAVANGSIREALDTAERVLRDAKRRGVLVAELPALKSAAPKAERPRRSFLEIEQIAAVLRAADLIAVASPWLSVPDPDNVRARILAPVRTRANELLEAERRLAIRLMAPHTLRRTFASILAVCDGARHGQGLGRDPRGAAWMHDRRSPRDL